VTHLRSILLLCTACASAAAQDSTARLKASDSLSLTSTPVVGAAPNEGEPVGYVKTVTGLAFVVTKGIPLAANIGTPVMQGSVLKTGAHSSLGVTFKDSTMLSFGPETELKLDEYTYQPAEGKLKFGSSLVRGTLNYISGVIAKLKPDGVSITTPSGMIGVRGTQFVAKVNPPEQ
jgi:hypothetical protein